MLSLATIVALASFGQAGRWLFHDDGSVWAHDYLAQWAAGRRLWEGQPALVYDWQAHEAFQARLIGVRDGVELYIFYPPPFLFTTLPFAPLDFIPATLAFLLTGIAAYAAALRMIVGTWHEALVVALGSGGAFYCLWYTQNGFLTAAIFTAALAVLDKRPILAGVLIGCLTIKPQLGVLIPLALVAGGHWRTIVAATATAIGLAIAAELLIGPGIWAAFAGSMQQTVQFLDGGNLWFKQQSIFALSLPLLGSRAAWLGHGLVAIGAAVIVTTMWRTKGVGQSVKSSALMSASLLVTPYLYVYDSVLLSAAAVMLLDRRTLPAVPLAERVGVFFCCALPFGAQYLFSAAVPFAAFILLYIAVRQAGRQAGDVAALGAPGRHPGVVSAEPVR